MDRTYQNLTLIWTELRRPLKLRSQSSFRIYRIVSDHIYQIKWCQSLKPLTLHRRPDQSRRILGLKRRNQRVWRRNVRASSKRKRRKSTNEYVLGWHWHLSEKPGGFQLCFQMETMIEFCVFIVNMNMKFILLLRTCWYALGSSIEFKEYSRFWGGIRRRYFWRRVTNVSLISHVTWFKFVTLSKK